MIKDTSTCPLLIDHESLPFLVIDQIMEERYALPAQSGAKEDFGELTPTRAIVGVVPTLTRAQQLLWAYTESRFRRRGIGGRLVISHARHQGPKVLAYEVHRRRHVTIARCSQLGVVARNDRICVGVSEKCALFVPKDAREEETRCAWCR